MDIDGKLLKIVSLYTQVNGFSILCFQGEGMTSIEPTTGTINDICTFPGSGLMLLALDCSQIPSYFIPDLGPAPNWCSYLQNLTVGVVFYFFMYWFGFIYPRSPANSASVHLFFLQEELEEGAQTTIYDDYKFLTKEDLERLRLTSLIGTKVLRAYMHGFFVRYPVYKKVRLPSSIYDDYFYEGFFMTVSETKIILPSICIAVPSSVCHTKF